MAESALPRSRPGLPRTVALVAATLALLALAGPVCAAPGDPPPGESLLRPLESYAGEEGLGLGAVLKRRAAAEPFNVVATAIFLLAILHTFLAPRLLAASHHLRERIERETGKAGHSFVVEMLHFLGEVEAVFGIWAVPLLLAGVAMRGWGAVEAYVGRVHFTEATFVVVIMAIAATRPVLAFAEKLLGVVAALGGRTPLAWWAAILTAGPLLGSFITEPAAMTICALLLSRHLYELGPSRPLAYGTLGLLFVNVSIGGTLTHFAAPPVLMVAGRWGWGLSHMLGSFGWKAALAVFASTALFAFVYRGELGSLSGRRAARLADAGARPSERGVPAWIVGVHLAFLGWTVFTAHTPALFVAGFLFFLAFTQATAPHQNPVNLRPALLVGFFLAGLVVHGTLQQWWIAPVLVRLDALPLFAGATVLTAFNDNAAITYLASLVPGFTPQLQYAVVAGAVAGGGLTVIANAPNPAGQSILSRYFPDGVSPLGLLLGALVPTLIAALAFLLLPG